MTAVDTTGTGAATVSSRHSPLADRADELARSSVDGMRGVRLYEEPFLTQVNLRVDPRSSAATGIERDLGRALPRTAGGVGGDSREAVLWLGPDEWLVVAPDGEAERIAATLRAALADAIGSVVDVSANRTTVRLEGPMAREVLEKVCALDLHPRAFGPGQCAETLLGRTQAVLWQVAEEPAYRILVRNSFADYLADLLLDAMAEYVHDPGPVVASRRR